MFENLNSEAFVEEASAEDLLIALGDPDKGPLPDKDKGTKPTDKNPAKSGTGSTGTSDKDLADIPKADLKAATTGQDDDDDDDDDEGKNDGKNTGTEGTNDDDDDEGKVKSNDAATTSEFLKSRVQFFIQNGEWDGDFEIDGKKPEDIEWDEDTFGEIDLQQRSAWKEQARAEIVNSYGPYGKAIADHIIAGGDPDTLIDIFKEQQEVKAFDISSESGQEDLVFRYQTEILGRKAERVKKDIVSWKADGVLEEEAKEAKTTWEQSLKKQETEEKQAAINIKTANENRAKENQRVFIENVTTVVNGNKEISDDEKKQVIKALTTYNQELPNGQKVNAFYSKLAEFKKSLPNYIDLVRFVLNKDKFIKTVKNTGKNTANDKSFRMIRAANDKKQTATGAGADQDGNNSPKRTGVRL